MSKQATSLLSQTAAATAATATNAPSGIMQRKCAACGTHTIAGGECDKCKNEPEMLQRKSSADPERLSVPPIVREVLSSPGRPLDPSARDFMEPRFGHDFSHVRIHTDEKAAQSAASVNALAYTVGRDVVFGGGQFSGGGAKGRQLLAHELTHVIQQSNTGGGQSVRGISKSSDPSERKADRVAEQVLRKEIIPGHEDAEHEPETPAAADHPVLHRQEAAPVEENKEEDAEEGIEIDPGELIMFPQWQFSALPEDPALQRQQSEPSQCDSPDEMTKVISGTFEGEKTLDDYFPDLKGAGAWVSNNTAGPFDTGKRAGSAVQLIGFFPRPCQTSTNPTTLAQRITIMRAKANGKKLMENGKVLEGQTMDDIGRTPRDQSRAPFRQTWTGAVSMADPISGFPYHKLASYEWESNMTASITGGGKTQAVDWGVTIEAAAGKVTKNDVR